MSNIRLPQNPGIEGLDELTQSEEELIQSISALGDPGADRILFWDESSNGYQFLTVGSGLTITDQTITASAGSGDITGSGTVNELAYFTAEKVIDNLPVATYPSLTELAYVKGVTSSIQTQLNEKAPSLGADDNYVTDAQLTVISNTSGTNTGDQTSIVGITGTKAQFDTAVTDGNFMYIGDAPTSHTHLLAAGATDVTATATELNILDGATLTTTELNYVDGVTSSIQTQLNAKGSGDVSKVGTPANNQVGVWTGDGTLEGTTGLTYDGTSLYLTGSIRKTTGAVIDFLSASGYKLVRFTNNDNVDDSYLEYYSDTNSVDMYTYGTATNIPLNLYPKGTGSVFISTQLELGNATDTTLSRVSAGVIAVEGVTIPTISSTNDISNKNLTTGNSISGEISIDGTPNTDATATGNVTSTFASGYSSAVGDLVFFGSGGKWLEVDADAVATCKGLLGIALEAKTDTQAMKVALPGSFVRLDSWNWTVGATLYAGETLGAMQETIPTGADSIVKPVAVAISADVIYFFPSPHQSVNVA